jgi:oxygen-dependent protoporphyrinogen oxidase
MRVGIIGGGISGLSCAWYLNRAGIDSVVFDPTPGGPIGTVVEHDCILETGPESWLTAKPHAAQLIRELGLGDELTGSNDAQRRTYVVRHGRFEVLPEGLQMVVPTKILPIIQTQLFTWNTKLRMGAEIFRSPKLMPDRSVAEFVRDHFGDEAVDYLAEPLLAGVYGGAPEDLSAPSVLPKFVEYEQRYGSVVVGTLRHKTKPGGVSVFQSMKHGMGTLINALVQGATIMRARAEAIAPGTESLWNIYADGAWHGFDRIVLACGANHSSGLLAPIDENLTALLATIPYGGSSIWTFGYRRDQVARPLDAFGFLVPRPERQTMMSCTWLGTKWLGRVPEDKAVFRCFSTQPDTTHEAMEADLKRLVPISGEPLFALCHRWPAAMPQYTVGHTVRAAAIATRAAIIPGFHLVGNAYEGIGIPDCIRNAKKAADAIAAATRLPQ